MTIPSENEIHRMVDKDPLSFEKYLLRAIDGSKSFFQRVRDTLCRTDTGTDVNDFTMAPHNEIYRALLNYYTIRPDMAAANISEQACRSFLQAAAEGGSGNIGLHEVDQIALYVRDVLQAIDPAEAVAMVSASYEYWLKKRRLRKLFNSVTSKENWNPDTFVDDAITQRKEIDRLREKKRTKFAFGDGMDEGEFDLERFSTGIPALDASLGGGWARTEYTLWIAPTGAGKTVMAMQQGVTLVRQKLKGIIISTEQRHIELEPRIVSAWANIPFDRIKDGIKERHLTHMESMAVNQLKLELKESLWIENWMHDRSKSILNDLDDLVESYKKEHGSCDFVILDWIGGALGERAKSNPEIIRHLFQHTSDKMADLARDHDIITHAFIQAHPGQARNKQEIDSSMISECKTAGVNATNILGISALLANADDHNTFKEEQYIHCSKSRKGGARKVRVRREFGYQRFKDWWT